MAKKNARVPSRPKRKKKELKRGPAKPWTVMLYMAASQDEQTEAAAIRDSKNWKRRHNQDVTSSSKSIDGPYPSVTKCMERQE
jgi:hypothetical protein